MHPVRTTAPSDAALSRLDELVSALAEPSTPPL